MSGLSQKAYLIFDRDGTLIELVPYLKSVAQVRFFDDVLSNLVVASQKGYSFGLITNQSVIARGIASRRDVEEVHQYLKACLMDYDIHFDFFLYCPHVPSDNCDCRKPATALGQHAILNFSINVKASYFVGDQVSDLEFARRLGLTPVGLRNAALLCEYDALYFRNLHDFVSSLPHRKGT